MANGPVGATDVRITIYDWTGTNVLVSDAITMGDFNDGVIQYEDTPSGCGAATLALGLRYEEVINRGYYQAFNIVEISTGDNLTTSTYPSGANTINVNSTLGFNTAYSPDSGQAYLWDASTLTIRIPAADSGSGYLTIGNPLGGGVVPGYVTGSTLGRRRYTGQIVRVSQPNQKQPKATVTCVGLNKLFDRYLGTFTYISQDVGTAIYLAIKQGAARWPQLTISSGNFPITGVLYTGTGQNVTVTSTINNALGAFVSGDLWAVRVGHDRTPRLIRLFNNGAQTYSYNIALPQGVTEFEPVNMLSEGQDASGYTNSVYVIGDTQPGTKQPYVANVQNTSAITAFGQWDTVVTNLQCKSTAACLAYGTAILNASDIAVANNSFRVYTRNDNQNPVNQPAGLSRGDVVCGVTNVTVSRFSGTGSVVNLVPDSEFHYYPGGIITVANALWTDVSTGLLVPMPGGGPSASGALEYTGTGSASGNLYAYSSYIDVVPGQVWTLSGYIDATHVTSGGLPYWSVWNYNGTVFATPQLVQVSQTLGVAGIVHATFTIPGGVTKAVVLCDFNVGVVASGQKLIFSQPQMQLGSAATAYVPNYGAPPLSGLLSSAQTTIDAHGDSWQDCKFEAVQPDWSAAMALRTNAVSTSLVSNAALGVGLDQYFVSPGAWPQPNGPSSSGLVVTPPVFQAVFTLGTQPVWIGTIQASAANGSSPIAIPALTANATNWVWLNTPSSYAPVSWSGTQVWSVKNDSTTQVSGGILYGIFQTSATAVVGATEKATIGSLGMPMGYLINGSAYAPTYAINTAPTILGTAGPVTSMVEVVFTITNQPADGSLSKVILWYKQSSQTFWIMFAASPPLDASGNALNISGPLTTTGKYTFILPELTNGINYDFGFTVESGAAGETPVQSLGTSLSFGNPAPGSMGLTIPPPSLPAYNANLVSDSSFSYSSFNTSGIAGASSPVSSYWFFNLIDGSSFSVHKAAPNGAGDNFLQWTSGSSGSANRYGFSEPIAVNPGSSYVVSAYFNARNVTGSVLPYVAIYDYTGLTVPTAPTSNLQSITIPAGTDGRIQVAWVCPSSGVSQIVVVLHSHACTINNTTGGVNQPGYLIGMDPQFELVSSTATYASPYKQTIGFLNDGSQANSAMSIPVQIRNAATPAGLRTGTSALRVDDLGVPGSVVGYLPQSNHDPTVVLGAVTGSQKNLVPDSGMIYGSGGNLTTYWSNMVYWNVANALSGGVSGFRIYFNPSGSGSNGFLWIGNGGSSGPLYTICAQMYLTGGTYTVSGYIDATNVSSGSPGWQLWSFPSGSIVTPEILATQTPGVVSRVSATGTVPTGNYVVIANTSNAVIGNSQNLVFESPQVESGSVVTAYQQTGIPDAGGSAIHATLVSTNLPAPFVSFTSATPPYLWGPAFNIDLTMYPTTQTFFLECAFVATLMGHSGLAAGNVITVTPSLSASSGTFTNFTYENGYTLQTTSGSPNMDVPGFFSIYSTAGISISVSFTFNGGTSYSSGAVAKVLTLQATRTA